MSLFLHLDMKTIICIGIFLFGAQNLISQQVTYNDSIDRVLEQYRKGNKIFNNNEKSTKMYNQLKDEIANELHIANMQSR